MIAPGGSQQSDVPDRIQRSGALPVPKAVAGAGLAVLAYSVALIDDDLYGLSSSVPRLFSLAPAGELALILGSGLLLTVLSEVASGVARLLPKGGARRLWVVALLGGSVGGLLICASWWPAEFLQSVAIVVAVSFLTSFGALGIVAILRRSGPAFLSSSLCLAFLLAGAVPTLSTPWPLVGIAVGVVLFVEGVDGDLRWGGFAAVRPRVVIRASRERWFVQGSMTVALGILVVVLAVITGGPWLTSQLLTVGPSSLPDRSLAAVTALFTLLAVLILSRRPSATPSTDPVGDIKTQQA